MWGWQQVRFHTMSMHTLWTASKLPCLGPHQTTRTALLPRPADMPLKPLGMGYHLHFVAQQSDVPDLSCIPPKMASLPVSFEAITGPRLHCSAPAQFLQVPHHPGWSVWAFSGCVPPVLALTMLHKYVIAQRGCAALGPAAARARINLTWHPMHVQPAPGPSAPRPWGTRS